MKTSAALAIVGVASVLAVKAVDIGATANGLFAGTPTPPEKGKWILRNDSHDEANSKGLDVAGTPPPPGKGKWILRNDSRDEANSKGLDVAGTPPPPGKGKWILRNDSRDEESSELTLLAGVQAKELPQPIPQVPELPNSSTQETV